MTTFGPPLDLLRPGRAITGWSAVLLPYTSGGSIDWAGFDRLLERTAAAGLVPAVNMDTGYANLLGDAERVAVLDRTASVLGGGRFAAGAFVADEPGAAFDEDAYAAEIAAITRRGAVPVVFPSYGLTGLPAGELVEAHRRLGQRCDAFVAFELSPIFAPFGAIYDLSVYRELLDIPTCIGAKHSSLRRAPEWERLRVRDEQRPGFHVFTGNDLAIDMVAYGSDYLLGLSALAPDVFGARDRAWAAGDPAYFELNDALQALGSFAFRPPVPAYKHTVAQVLWLRGWLHDPSPHPRAPRRPESDVEVLQGLLSRLEDR